MKELVRGSDLTPAHLQLLEERYCSGGAGDLSDPSTWVAGQPQIDWRGLTSDVEAATHYYQETTDHILLICNS